MLTIEQKLNCDELLANDKYFYLWSEIYNIQTTLSGFEWGTLYPYMNKFNEDVNFFVRYNKIINIFSSKEYEKKVSELLTPILETMLKSDSNFETEITVSNILIKNFHTGNIDSNQQKKDSDNKSNSNKTSSHIEEFIDRSSSRYISALVQCDVEAKFIALVAAIRLLNFVRKNKFILNDKLESINTELKSHLDNHLDLIRNYSFIKVHDSLSRISSIENVC